MTDPKGRLQQQLQQKGLSLPKYHSRSSGQPHCPTVACTVTVHYCGKVLREEAEQKGGKKRDAEKLAAEKMLQRIRREDMAVPGHRDSHLLHSSRVSSSPPASLPPARHVSLAVATRSGSLSPHRSPSPSAAPTPNGRSPVSVLQERLQGTCLSLPQYQEERLSTTAFRYRCVVCNGLQQPVLESRGEGRSKRNAKDAAAKDMLQKMDASGDVLPSVMASAAVPTMPEVLDPGLHDDIATHLAPYSPQYHFWRSPGEVRIHLLYTLWTRVMWNVCSTYCSVCV